MWFNIATLCAWMGFKKMRKKIKTNKLNRGFGIWGFFFPIFWVWSDDTINRSYEYNCYWQTFCPRCHVMAILLWPLAARRRCATRPATQHPLCSSPWQPAKLKLKFTHSRPDSPLTPNEPLFTSVRAHLCQIAVFPLSCRLTLNQDVQTELQMGKWCAGVDASMCWGGGTILPTHTANKIRSSSQRTEPQQQEIIVRSIFSSLSISFSDIKMALVYQHQAEWLASICTYQYTI